MNFNCFKIEESSKNFPRNHAAPGLFFKNCSGDEVISFSFHHGCSLFPIQTTIKNWFELIYFEADITLINNFKQKFLCAK